MIGKLCALVVAVFVIGSCGLPPIEQDVALGRRTADAMSGQIGLYDGAAVQRVVDRVGRSVVARIDASPFRYELAILDQPEPNAFAAPGGFVFVSRGLLAIALSEDELAGVLGHEAVHVEHRHTVRQMTSSRGILGSVLALPGRVVGVVAEDLGDVLAGPFEAFAVMRQASYSRSQEAEADEAGARLAAGAGYDPVALARILERMERLDETVTGERRRPSFFDSHPATPQRAEALEEYAASTPRGPRASSALDDDAFVRTLDGLVWGVNPAQGEFRGATFLHPDLDFALQFPSGWQTANTARFAAALSPDESSILAIGVAAEGGPDTVDHLAEARKAELQREAGLSPRRDEPFEMDGRHARLLAYTDGRGDRKAHVFWVWVAHEGLVLGLVGLVPDAGRDQMRAAVESLRPLTAEERGSFRIERVRVVEARAGESVDELGTRTQNALTPEVTAVINGVARDVRLEAGRLVKIVERGPYR